MPRPHAAARRHLSRKDPTLAAVIKRVGPCRLGEEWHEDPFAALTQSITSQQLSTKAAATIYGRFCDLFAPARVPSASAVLALDEDTLRAAGFSRPKARYLRDLAERVADGRLDLHALDRHGDDDVLAMLTEVKGIGRWTAEIFLLFRLGRPDVLPADDLGLLTAAQRVYGLRKRPTPDRLRRLAEPWRPYRSVAAWYLWASLTT